MNISCCICSDLFDPGAEVHVTKCGHMFHYVCLMNWLQRSRTCPQCRTKVTETSFHRVYFNLANTDTNFTDLGTVVAKLETVQFQLSLKEKAAKNLREETDKLKKQNVGLRQEVANLEQAEKTHESVIHALKDQISYFKNKSKETDRLTEELVRLKNKIRELENTQKLGGSIDDVNEILRSEKDIESLALYAAMLKKSLVEADLKKHDSQHSLRKAQHELTRYKRENHTISTELSEMKLQLQQLKKNHSREKNLLMDQADKDIMAILINKQHDNYYRTTNINQDENIMDNTSTESPYLRIKPNPVEIGYNSILNTRIHSTTTTPHRGYSIFKSSGAKLEDVKLPKQKEDIMYNGLGGSSKCDILPSPRPAPVPLKRKKPSSTVSSHKFKKLAPTKSTKVTDYINLVD